MRTLKLLALGVLLVMGAALPVNAQTPELADDSAIFLQRQLRRAMEGADLHRQLDVHHLQRADRRGRGCTLDWRRNTVRYRRRGAGLEEPRCRDCILHHQERQRRSRQREGAASGYLRPAANGDRDRGRSRTL